MNATWNDEDSDYYKDYKSNFITFATKSNVTGVAVGENSSQNSSGVPTLTYEYSDDEELTEETRGSRQGRSLGQWSNDRRELEGVQSCISLRDLG